MQGITIKDYGNETPGNGSREEFEALYGQVWNTQELQSDYDVIGFSAPFVVVIRKSDRVKGSLEFSHSPRFYFSFRPA